MDLYVLMPMNRNGIKSMYPRGGLERVRKRARQGKKGQSYRRKQEMEPDVMSTNRSEIKKVNVPNKRVR